MTMDAIGTRMFTLTICEDNDDNDDDDDNDGTNQQHQGWS